jgi:Tfp pilus assembly protein PilW
MRNRNRKKNEKGTALVELAIGLTIFLTVVFGIIEFSRALWTHSALTNAARKGARYATLQCMPTEYMPADTKCPTSGTADTRIKNVVVYGTDSPASGAKPVVNGLSTANVKLQYANFALGKGTVSVTITGYQFGFLLPLLPKTINMPSYNTTLTGENIGWIPADM